MKNYLLLFILIFSVTIQSQTYPTNPTAFGKITINTNEESTTATKINVQEDNNRINWLRPINIPITITPTNYTPTSQTFGGHLAGIDAKFGQQQTTAGQTTRVYFTADNVTVNSVDYFQSSTTGKGTATAGSPATLSLGDNVKSFFTKDVISILQPALAQYPAGTYAGQLTVSATPTPNATQQRFTVEIYKTNSLGIAIASGVSGAPIGSLGVAVITILDSGLVNLTAGAISNVSVSGQLTGQLTINANERIKYHVSAQKVGTGGGNITMQVYYGSNYNSYYDVPIPITTDAVLNKSTITPAVNLTDALNNLNTALGTNSIATAYVETNGNNATAQIGNSKKAYLTIDAALDALPSTGGVVKIGTGSFLSPVSAKIKSNCKFFGQGKPVTNSVVTESAVGVQPTITSPTKLIGGTILLGKVEVSLKDGVEFHNLGVDSGLDYCNTYTAGVATEGLVFVQQYNLSGGLPSADGLHQLQTNSPPRTGIVVENVSVLCKSATAAVHAMLIENTLNAKISNVSTYYGVHGLVIKSIGCSVNGFDGHGHATNGLLFKANDYAYGNSNTASNIYITSIVSDDGGGINFITEQPSFGNGFNNISNFNVEYTKYGVSNTLATEGNSISNGVIYKTSGIGLDIDSDFINSAFSNIDQRSGTTGFLVNQNNAQHTNLTFVNCKSASNSVKGFDLTATLGSTIHIVNSDGANSIIGSVISGNIYGNFKEIGGITGAFKFDSTSGTEFIPSISSKGIINKSSATVATNGSITAQNINLPNSGIPPITGIYQGSNFVQLVGGSAGVLINNSTNTVNNLSLTDAGVFKLTNLAGTGIRTVVADASGNLIATDLAPTSGTYTPTTSSLVNITSISNVSGIYTKIGNIVTVTVKFLANETAANTLTSFNFTLPINRTSSSVSNNFGSGNTVAGSVNRLVTVNFTASTSVASAIYSTPSSFGGAYGSVTFQYDVTQ